MFSTVMRRGPSRLAFNNSHMFTRMVQPKIFSNLPPRDINPTYSDLADITKVNYTEEYDQGLTDE